MKAAVATTLGRHGPRRIGLMLGVGGLLLLVLAALVGPAVLPGDALVVVPALDLATPGQAGRLGRAEHGVDLLFALLGGARTSLGVASVVSSASMVVSLVVACIAALGPAVWRAVLPRVIDVVLAIPGLLLALALAALLPPSWTTVVVALTVTSWAGNARVLCGVVDALALRSDVVAARALGASTLRIALHHVLPAVAPAALVLLTSTFSSTVLAEASLAFLGLGVPSATPSWGALLDQGMANLLVAPHVGLTTTCVLAFTTLCVQLVGDGLRDLLAVRDADRDTV